LAKCAAHLTNWSNARAFGQMRSAFNQWRTPKFKPAAVDELHSAFGHWCK